MLLQAGYAIISVIHKSKDVYKRQDLCVACGSCTFACPAKRPVAQNMGLAKAWYMGELRKGGK